jgi:hypothetical protein
MSLRQETEAIIGEDHIGRKRWSQMRHEWQCSTCEQIFTRKWNCQRHVKDSHAGNGQVVPVSVYPSSGGKGGKQRNGGNRRHRNGGYFYDYRSLGYASGAFAGMGNYYSQGSLVAAGPYRKNRQAWLAKWDVQWEQARRITENMEKVFKGPSPQAVASVAPRGIPTEIIVGTVCEKCGTVSYLPLPHPYTGSYDVVNLCACNNRDKPVEEDSQRRSVNIHEKISPETLKRMVDSWLMGYQKYLAAYRLPLEQLRALPASGELKWYEIDAAKLKNNGNAEEEEGERMVNEPRPHTNNYIVRAIRNSDQSPGGSVRDDQTIDAAEDVFYGWVPLTEDEVFDFLTKARATAMFCHVVYSRNGNGSGGDGDGSEENGHWYYYLKIVPPHEIAAPEQREQNAVIKSMIKEMYTEMMSELKKEEEEEKEQAIHNHAEPREDDKENHSGSDLREEPTIAAGRDRLRARPTRERQNKQSKKQDHEQKQQPQRQEELDNNNGLPSRSKEKDEILKISEIRAQQYFEHIFGSNHDSAYPSSDNSRYCRYAIQDLIDGPTDKQSWYLGLEIDKGDTRIWGFPGESTQMMHPKSRELQRQLLGVGGINDHPDDGKNRQQVCYGMEYPGRMMSSFLFGLPPLEDIELDLKGNKG